MLAGEAGLGTARAMRILTGLARSAGAGRLIPITGAHIDGCLYHGQAGLDLAERLAEEGARTTVPTTLNVSSLDLRRPDNFRGDPALGASAKALMDAHTRIGARPTWTCAPYLLPGAPGLGEHVAWGESNAIVFANSVLGARTERYGDFTDLTAAICGRAPDVGLHRDEGRVATVVIDATAAARWSRPVDLRAAVIGHLVGELAEGRIAVIVGLDDADAVSTDRLRALGAAAASSGSVGLVHVAGATPEAPDAATAAGGRVRLDALPRLRLGPEDLEGALRRLGRRTGRPFAGVSLGTPHASATELTAIDSALAGRSVHPSLEVYVSAGRDVLATVPDVVRRLEAAGVRIVTDTCTYITPIIVRTDGLFLTDSAKWAYYAPANLGVDVAIASLEECIESAVGGVLLGDGAAADAATGDARR
jgi:predicted aconitase